MTEKETDKFLPPHLVVKRKVDNTARFNRAPLLSPAVHKTNHLRNISADPHVRKGEAPPFTPRLSQCLAANQALQPFRIAMHDGGIRSIMDFVERTNAEIKQMCTGMQEKHCLVLRDCLSRAKASEKVKAEEKRRKEEEESSNLP